MSKLVRSHWWAVAFIVFFPLVIMNVYSEFIRSSELNARLGWLVLIGGLAYLFRYTWLKSLLLGILALLAFSGGMDIVYAVTFGGVFTSASFEAMAQTDVNEGWEFLLAYTNVENVFWVLLYFAISYYSLKSIIFKEATRRRQKILLALGVIMVFVALQQIYQRGRTFDTIPGFTGVAIDYVNNQDVLDNEIKARQELFNTKTFVARMASNQPQTYVVVIGESLNRNHMSFYGYPRQTTPELGKHAERIIRFDDVISAYAQTRPSLTVALTESNLRNRLPEKQALSLVGLFKKAGFKTWWISNQQPLRKPTTALASLADEAHFISHDFHGVEVRRYDGNLLPPLEKALFDKAKHKVIFLHMMGSHLQYRNRYPEDRTIFSGNEGVQAYKSELSSRQLRYINEYDDSVHYTDTVLGRIILLLGQQKGLAAMSFFADHGEEVYDNRNFIGHGPDGVTADMLEVPFLVWRNETYSDVFAEHDKVLQEQTQHPMVLDDYFHFALCLAGVQSDVYLEQATLCSEGYQAKPRVIYGKNYDKEIR